MNMRRTFRNYQTWVVLSTLVVTMSLVMLNNMVSQLASDQDIVAGNGQGTFLQPRDTHVRSIRNYEHRAQEKSRLLQVLQPAVESIKVSNQHDKLRYVDQKNQNTDTGMSKISDSHNKAYVKNSNMHNIQQQFSEDNYGETDDEDDDDGDEYTDDIHSNDKDDDGDNDDEINSQGYDNREFKPGDFPDVVDFKKPPFQYEEINQSVRLNRTKSETNRSSMHLSQRKVPVHNIHHHRAHRRLNQNFNQLEAPMTVDGTVSGPYSEGIYWTGTAEQTVPKGMSMLEREHLLQYVRRQPVRSLRPPLWNKCGRPLNGVVNLLDGSTMCARYRTPHNKFILGEILSFHLSQMLGMDNIPPVILSWVNSTSSQWRGINYTSLQWQDNQMVALIDWVPDLNVQGSQVVIPPLIHQAYLNRSSVTSAVLSHHNLCGEELSQLVQWGDMIIFDYLTGNYDRYASMQDAADKESKPSILLEHVRNLKKSVKSGKLWLIDNESGLFDAYDLLYLEPKHKFIEFHSQMLRTMCVFQKKLINKLETLLKTPRPDMALLEFTRKREPLLDSIPRDIKDKSYNLFQEKFVDRLKEVMSWVHNCNLQSQHHTQ